jgi:tRNA(Arg) A34 adenosine deaminase TadA
MIYVNNIIDELLLLADKAAKNGDIPVGAVVVKDNKIIGKGYNTRHLNKDITGHAEINAIKDASNYLSDWRLNGCDIYVTLEPCDMCLSVIKESRIDNVYYILPNEEKHHYKKTSISNVIVPENIQLKIKEKLSDFFAKNLKR